MTPPATLHFPGHAGGATASWSRAGETGFIRTGVSATATRVVVCGDCGYFMLFATPQELQDVRARWAELVAAPPS